MIEIIPTAHPITSERMRNHASTSGRSETVTLPAVASNPIKVA